MVQQKRVGVHVILRTDLYLSLKHFAKLNNQPVTVLLSRLLAQALEPQETDSDPLALLVRRAVNDNVKSMENKLAKLAANTAMTSATGMYLGIQCAADLGARGVIEMHKQAAILARKHWRNTEGGSL